MASGMHGKARRPKLVDSTTGRHLTGRVWFRILTALLMAAPVLAEKPVPSQETSQAIFMVLSNPLAAQVPALLPLAKLLLALAAISPSLVGGHRAGRVLCTYYAALLVLVGFLQNMAFTSTYGFVWVLGNTVVQLMVAASFVFALAREPEGQASALQPQRLWLLLPMALALVEPYAAAPDGTLVRAFGPNVLTNDTGVTYCMITPVVLGSMLLYDMEKVEGPAVDDTKLQSGNATPGVSASPITVAISYAAYVGLLFGLLNLLTWFVFIPASWWMGVLHLPLVVVSIYGISRCRRS